MCLLDTSEAHIQVILHLFPGNKSSPSSLLDNMLSSFDKDATTI